MTEQKRYKITLECLDDPEFTVTFDDVSAEIIHEVGFATAYKRGSDTPHSIHRNGQKRILIKAWRGCSSYESFKASTLETLPSDSEVEVAP